MSITSIPNSHYSNFDAAKKALSGPLGKKIQNSIFEAYGSSDIGGKIQGAEQMLSNLFVESADKVGNIQDKSFKPTSSAEGNYLRSEQSNNIPDKETLQQHSTYAHIAADCAEDNENSQIGDYKRTENYKNDESGFAASVYKKDNSNEIVIAYRCTSNQEGVESDIQMGQDQLPNQYEDAIKLYNQIKAENPDAEITLVGHSLGGSLAQLVAASDKDAKAIAFDPYGTSDIIKSDDNLNDNNNCINYTTEGSIVSGISEHPGKTLTVKSSVVEEHSDEDLSPKDQIALRHKVANYYDLENAEFVNNNDANLVRKAGKWAVNKLVSVLGEKGVDLVSTFAPGFFFP